MKRFWKFVDFLYENEILTLFAYIITLVWYGYIGHLIFTYGGIVAKIFYYLWIMVSIFMWLVRKCKEE